MHVKKESWYRKRGYIHFDLPLGFESAKKLVTNKKSVAEHSFYPLIDYQVTIEKINKNAETGIIEYIEKKRPIAYSAHKDSLIYSYYAEKLSQIYEEKLESNGLSDSVLAFRSLGKSNIDFAKIAFDEIRRYGNCSAVALDISGFFDNLDHEIIKVRWCNLIDKEKLPDDHFAIYKSITKFSKVERQNLYKQLGISIHNPKNKRKRICSPEDFRNKVRKSGTITTNQNKFGIPQGSPISALISNVYMLEFDKTIKEAIDEQGGTYFRYCDDMLFIVPTGFRDNVAGFVQSEIEKLKININTKKTEIRNFTLENEVLKSDKSLQYLGFTFDGQRILIRSSALARYSDRMKRGVKLAKATMRKHNKIRKEKGQTEHKLYKNKLYKKYSHLGSRNFLSYGYRAAKTLKSRAIKKQLKPLWDRLEKEMSS